MKNIIKKTIAVMLFATAGSTLAMQPNNAQNGYMQNLLGTQTKSLAVLTSNSIATMAALKTAGHSSSPLKKALLVWLATSSATYVTNHLVNKMSEARGLPQQSGEHESFISVSRTMATQEAVFMATKIMLRALGHNASLQKKALGLFAAATVATLSTETIYKITLEAVGQPQDSQTQIVQNSVMNGIMCTAWSTLNNFLFNRTPSN